MFYRIAFIFFVGTSLVLINACTKDSVAEEEVDADCSETISFQSDINQMIQQSCATSGCHDAGAASQGYVFEDYEQIADNADIMLKTIRHESGVANMPIGDKLSDNFIEKFFCWIEQGKEDN